MASAVKPALLVLLLMFLASPEPALGATRRFNFEIKMQKVKRLCHEKSIVTVNGQFPGPQMTAVEGDRVIVRVVNRVQYNVTIHWHGVRQQSSGWADGAAYITQCPIQKGQRFVYDFSVSGHTGTLFWHAHISWLRVTLYGPLIILPKKAVPYPFSKPYKQVPILIGEWWNSDTEAIIEHTLRSGGRAVISDAYTINGLPGPSYKCSSIQDTYKLRVEPGKTYLLRLINAALNSDFFFGIANHTLTVVEADANYVKQFGTDSIVLSPGQTTNVLIKTKDYYAPHAPSFLMVAKPHPFGPKEVDFNLNITSGILEYETSSSNVMLAPQMPDFRDEKFSEEFRSKLRSIGDDHQETKVPQRVDRHFMFTVGLGSTPCPPNQECQGLNGQKLAAPINNMTFEHSDVSLLQAYYFNQSGGVYTTDFPENPPMKFDYTGNPPSNPMTTKGTKVVVLPFNTNVQVILQGTSIIASETHPFHLHGFDFYVVGHGTGNFNPEKDPAEFNLVDPVKRNTVNMPAAGWVAIRFVADNPGVWLMHCHLEIHSSWGMEMAWIVLNGKGPYQKLIPPPADLPRC